MPMVHRAARKLLFGSVIARIVLVLGLCTLVVLHGFPYRFMDLDDSGNVSLREALQTLDLGTREASEGGGTCVEIFHLKDGLPLKAVCGDI